MGIVAELNVAASKDHNKDRQALARQYATEIDIQMKWLLASGGDVKAMIELNGTWICATKLLEIMGEPAPPNPRSDEMQVDERKAA